MAKSKYDWLTICEEFVNSPSGITLQELAAKYDIPYHVICNKSSKDKWVYKHERFLMRLTEQTSENKAVAVASKGRQWDDRCMEMAERIMDLAAEEVAGHPIKDRKGEVIMGGDGKPLLFKASAKDVATAVKAVQEIGKSALGDKPNGDLALTVSVREYVESKS